MKWYFLVFLLLATPVLAHSAAETMQTTTYTFELRTEPDQLEPDTNTLIVTVLNGTQAVAKERVWLRLSDDRRIYFSGVFTTDEFGNVPIAYYFNGPGTYTLTVEVHGERADLPVHVHGQYMLLIGFLAASMIVLALVLDKL